MKNNLSGCDCRFLCWWSYGTQGGFSPIHPFLSIFRKWGCPSNILVEICIKWYQLNRTIGLKQDDWFKQDDKYSLKQDGLPTFRSCFRCHFRGWSPWGGTPLPTLEVAVLLQIDNLKNTFASRSSFSGALRQQLSSPNYALAWDSWSSLPLVGTSSASVMMMILLMMNPVE